MRALAKGAPMNQRNAMIDAARGIGIILVVFGHNWIVTHERGELFRVVFSFHVPLFFFLAGIFLRSSDRLAPFAAARADSLLKPYFVVLLAFGLYKLSAAALNGTVDGNELNYFAGVLYGTGVSLDWTPMWFLPHLFLASVACLVALRQTKAFACARWVVLFFAVALLLGGIYTSGFFQQQAANFVPPIGWGNLPGLPWSIDLVPVTMAFMLMGYLLGQPVQGMRLQWAPLTFALVVFVGLHWRFDEAMDFNLRIYGDPIISTLQAAAGIYLTLALAVGVQRLAPLGQLLAYVGSGSLFILIFHGYLQDRTFGALSRLGTHRYLNGALSLAAGVVVPLLMWELAKRQKLLGGLLLPQGWKRLWMPARQT
jgi:polysaccharide biosynthesis protein PslL